MKLTNSRRQFLRSSGQLAAGIALSQLTPSPLLAQPSTLPKIPEIRHKNGVLNAVIQLGDADRNVPNTGTLHLRMFQGWPLSETSASAAPAAAAVSPGPTLRTRVGGRVNIMLLNSIDDSKFSYTRDGKGCDVGVSYPFADTFPNCFHGSSTSNLHFHGTHTTPDGIGDNVVVQVIPDKGTKQTDWAAMFAKIFNAIKPPSTWAQMPVEYQVKQLGYTAQQFVDAAKSGQVLPKGGLVGHYDQGLWEFDRDQVVAGLWPQYVVGAFPNSFVLPDFNRGGVLAGQAPGTHWYHAHKHGSTSLHILNGLAGAFIVEGDYDDKIRAFFQKQLKPGVTFTEQVILFQQIVASQNLIRAIKLPGPTGDNSNTGANQKLVNGTVSPIISMKPGEVQLWRLVNACGGGGKGTIDPTMFQQMTAAGFEFRQVAMDGVQFSWENYLAQPFGVLGNPVGGINLAGGNRADILVKAPATAGVRNVLIPNDLNTPTKAQSLIFQIDVSAGDDLKMRFFGPLDKFAYPPMPAFLQDLKPPTATPRQVNFTMSGPGGAGPNPPGFFINGKQFDSDTGAQVMFCPEKNAVEDWILTNDNNGAAHPFHIHINPFQVVEVNTPSSTCSLGGGSCSLPTGNCACTPANRRGTPIWQDVIAIPPGGSVRIRQKFADFTGTYVLHCHILAHEDRGMMQLVRVIPAGANPATACIVGKVAHH